MRQFEIWLTTGAEPEFIGYSRATNFVEAAAEKMGKESLDLNEDGSVKLTDGHPTAGGYAIVPSKELALAQLPQSPGPLPEDLTEEQQEQQQVEAVTVEGTIALQSENTVGELPTLAVPTSEVPPTEEEPKVQEPVFDGERIDTTTDEPAQPSAETQLPKTKRKRSRDTLD